MRLWSVVSSHDVEAVAVVQVVHAVFHGRVLVPWVGCGAGVVPAAAGGGAAGWPSDLHVRDELQQLLLADHALERRHDRLEARRRPSPAGSGSTRGGRPRRRRPSRRPCSCTVLSEQPRQRAARGPARRRWWQVMQPRSVNSFSPAAAGDPPARAAARARPGSRSAPSRSTQPIIPSASCRSTRRRRGDTCPASSASNHSVGVAAGHDVRLHAERRDEEAVDHVLGGHRSA